VYSQLLTPSSELLFKRHNNGLTKHRQIRRGARGDQIPVDHDWAVFTEQAGVHQVILDCADAGAPLSRMIPAEIGTQPA
jgi:hypothetical protein